MRLLSAAALSLAAVLAGMQPAHAEDVAGTAPAAVNGAPAPHHPPGPPPGKDQCVKKTDGTPGCAGDHMPPPPPPPKDGAMNGTNPPPPQDGKDLGALPPPPPPPEGVVPGAAGPQKGDLMPPRPPQAMRPH